MKHHNQNHNDQDYHNHNPHHNLVIQDNHNLSLQDNHNLLRYHNLSIQQIFLAFFSGGLLTLAFPRFNISILAWIGLISLFFSLKNASLRASFFLGWICGLSYFGGTLYWVIETMAIYGHIVLWQSLLISLALVSYLSLFIGSFALLWNWFRRRFSSVATVFIAPLIWTCLEFLRAHLLTGFPWSTLGYSQYMHLQLIQFSDMTGVYGVSFLIVLVNAGLFTLFEYILAREAARETNWKAAHPASAICIALILIAAVGLAEGYGAHKLHARQPQTEETLTVGIVQGNIPQEEKWNCQLQDAIYSGYQALTLLAARQKPNVIIWPETSAPFINEQRGDYLDHISPLAQKAGVPLVVGSPRIAREITGEISLKNSAFLLSSEGKILDYYDKIHLVPFGEYLPLGQILSHLGSVVNEIGEFSSGNRYTIFQLGHWRFGVVICYEVIFPNLFRKFARQGVNFMVNITNDAWFDQSSAPYQHFSMVVFRAIESGISVVRVANTGISGMIDPWGRVLLETPLFHRLAMVRPLKLYRENTFYVRHGDLFVESCLIILGLLLILGYYKVYQAKRRLEDKI
jgi:apolipoprotein N-acyltransferase